MTRCKLKGQWTAADYAEQESSDDEDTAFDIATRHGSQIEAAPILDRVVTIWDPCRAAMSNAVSSSSDDSYSA